MGLKRLQNYRLLWRSKPKAQVLKGFIAIMPSPKKAAFFSDFWRNLFSCKNFLQRGRNAEIKVSKCCFPSAFLFHIFRVGKMQCCSAFLKLT